MKRTFNSVLLQMIAVLLFCSTLSMYAQSASCTEGANVTQNSGVTVSGTIEQTANPPSRIIDNNVADGSRWSVNSFPTVGVIDLQATYSINKMELFPYQNRAYKYKIEVSTNGSSYTQVVDRTANTTSGESFVNTFTAIDARYVRVTVLGCNCGTSWSSITELKVFCAGTTTPPPTCGSPSGGPTDNPIAAAYPGEYPWTSDIKWNCVYNVNDYSGTATQKFNAAQTAAFNNGGGVVYFPAGTYTFTDNLLVKSGVVIRGATPSNTDAKSSAYNPGTNFEFPQYVFTESGSGTDNSTAFKMIRLEEPNTASNVGMVYVDVNRAGIEFIATDKPNATGENMVFYGVRTNNVAKVTPNVPDASKGQKAYQRHSYRFAYNILAYNKKNLLVANTRHNDAITDNYAYSSYVVDNGGTPVDLTDGKYVFRYTDHYVIEAGQGSGSCSAGTPATCPENFREGVVIRDNWAYHTMRTAILARGQGLKIIDNVIRDQENKVHYVHPVGDRLVGNANTLENRAIDWAGWDVDVSGNDYMVRRHKLKTGPYYSVDGEGILIQECCGGTTVNGLVISDNIGNGGYIGLYKTRDINNVLIEGNNLVKGAPSTMSADIYVWADINNGPFSIYNADVIGNTIEGGISYRGSASAGSGNAILNNTNPLGSGTIKHTCLANVNISGNTGFTVEACTGPTSRQALVEESPELVKSLTVSPNPTSGLMKFNFTDEVEGKLIVVDSYGREVYSTDIKDQQSLDVNLSDYPSGLYFGKLMEAKKTTTIKIIVN